MVSYLLYFTNLLLERVTKQKWILQDLESKSLNTLMCHFNKTEEEKTDLNNSLMLDKLSLDDGSTVISFNCSTSKAFVRV